MLGHQVFRHAQADKYPAANLGLLPLPVTSHPDKSTSPQRNRPNCRKPPNRQVADLNGRYVDGT